MLDKIEFRMPEFVRWIWSSEDLKNIWEPRILRIRKAWKSVEWLSVAVGIRECALVYADPKGFISEGHEWVQNGLTALPLCLEGHHGGTVYSVSSVQAKLGDPFSFRFVLGSSKAVLSFQEAWASLNTSEGGRRVAELLGYPPCCYDFFDRIWIREKLQDSTWPMAVGTASSTKPDDRTVEVVSEPEINILWRWMGGIRIVPHLPCSFGCEASLALGRQMMALGREKGYAEEMNWLREILSWPVEWSALHGIAEIKTPILKFIAQTDATSLKYVVRKRGNSYPQDGPKGVVFPYTSEFDYRPDYSTRIECDSKCMSSSADLYPEWYAIDNGFKHTFIMDIAHEPIFSLAVRVIDGEEGSVLDLGCGNGALLKKIYERNERIIPMGIDSNPLCIKHARELLPQFADNFAVQDMLEDKKWLTGCHFKIIIFMPGRLIDICHAKAEMLRRRLREHSDYLLIYAYGDWLERYGNLDRLAQNVGLLLLNSDPNVKCGLAKVK